jgi:hypothetical protein
MEEMRRPTKNSSRVRGPEDKDVLRKVQGDKGGPNPEKVTMKNDMPALRGVCPVYGLGMYKLG